MHRAFEQALNAPVVSQLKKTAHHLHQMQPDALGVVGLAEPCANHLCGLIAADQRHQRLGIQKLLLHELAEIVANPVFIARDDRRMARDKGIGTRRKSATTANQSASAPTIAASAMALTPRTQKVCGRNRVVIKAAAATSSSDSASSLARLSSAIFPWVKDRGKRGKVQSRERYVIPASEPAFRN